MRQYHLIPNQYTLEYTLNKEDFFDKPNGLYNFLLDKKFKKQDIISTYKGNLQYDSKQIKWNESCNKLYSFNAFLYYALVEKEI